MLPIHRHLGEDLDSTVELLVGHWSEPGRGDLENQGVPRVAGSESLHGTPGQRKALLKELIVEVRVEPRQHHPDLPSPRDPGSR